jgi:RHS repeat-associated protein
MQVQPRDALPKIMLARYYGANLGRFLSVDPAESSARRKSPQSWNRYAYVLNNPLVLVDPDGANARWATGPNKPTRQEKNRIVEGLAQAARNPDVKARLQNMESSSVDFQVGTKSLPSGTYAETQPAAGSTVGNTPSAEMNFDFQNTDADRGQPGAPASDVELVAHEVDHGSNMSTPQGRAVIATQPTQEESAADTFGKQVDSDPATQAPATKKEKKEIKKQLKK